MRLHLFYIINFVLLFLSNSHAQLFKKNVQEAEKHIKEIKEDEIPSIIDSISLQENPNKKSKTINIPETRKSIKKDQYFIDVLIALDLDDLENRNINSFRKLTRNEKNLIQLIEGMQLAIDTLNQDQKAIILRIHDIKSKEKNDIKKDLESSDLIISHLLSDDLEKVCKWIGQKEIMHFSTLSPKDPGITENPYFYIFNSKLHTHIEELLLFGQSRFENDPKFFIYENSTHLNEENFNKFNTFFGNNAISSFDWLHENTKNSLKEILLPNRTNVLYFNTMNPKYIKEILDFLAEFSEEETYEFAIMTMPNWVNFIRNKDWPNSFNFFSTEVFYYDQLGALSEWINASYENRHGDNANNMVYKGFELIFSLGNALHKHGNLFGNELTNGHTIWNFSRFNFQAQYDEEEDKFLYYENVRLNIIYQHKNQSELFK